MFKNILKLAVIENNQQTGKLHWKNKLSISNKYLLNYKFFWLPYQMQV